MSDTLPQIGGMKKNQAPVHRRSTFLFPRSARPDRFERGLRMLRALRLSLEKQGAFTTPARQCEFDFVQTRA